MLLNLCMATCFTSKNSRMQTCFLSLDYLTNNINRMRLAHSSKNLNMNLLFPAGLFLIAAAQESFQISPMAMFAGKNMPKQKRGRISIVDCG